MLTERWPETPPKLDYSEKAYYCRSRLKSGNWNLRRLLFERAHNSLDSLGSYGGYKSDRKQLENENPNNLYHWEIRSGTSCIGPSSVHLHRTISDFQNHASCYLSFPGAQDFGRNPGVIPHGEQHIEWREEKLNRVQNIHRVARWAPKIQPHHRTSKRRS